MQSFYAVKFKKKLFYFVFFQEKNLASVDLEPTGTHDINNFSHFNSNCTIDNSSTSTTSELGSERQKQTRKSSSSKKSKSRTRNFRFFFQIM